MKIAICYIRFVDKGTVLVVVTDQRLMFVNHGMIYGTDFREIPFRRLMVFHIQQDRT